MLKYVYRQAIFCQFAKDCKYGLSCPLALDKEEENKVQYNWVIQFMKEKPECFKVRRKK